MPLKSFSGNMRYNLRYLILFVTFLLISCDNGIEPKPEQNVEQISGFKGTITFIGEWPDSIMRTHIVIFKDPLLQPNDFVLTNLRFISNEIPFGSLTYNFSSLDSAVIPPSPGPFEPGEYAYVAVAHQATENLSLARRDWFVSGVYHTNGNTSIPGIMTVPENRMVENINIECDFNNPPPQPPGGI